MRERLALLGLDAALIIDPRHVYYLSGYFVRRIYSPILLIEQNGPTTLSIPIPAEFDVAADETFVYESHRIGTLVDHQLPAAIVRFARKLESLERIGCDIPLTPAMIGRNDLSALVDLSDALLALRRGKDPDEIGFLRRIIHATEAGYNIASLLLCEKGKQGVLIPETFLYQAMLGSILSRLGEPIGDFGNDFQIGSMGGLPRTRVPEHGEAAILDLTVECRGYRSDMCRTFIIGPPSKQQQIALARVLEVLAAAEKMIRPGVRCRDVYEVARSMLNGYEGWSFPHHLGHGIGLSQHEAPRVNPHWDDVFAPGDVFTLEPGLYGGELRAGVRVEQIYALTESGLTVLTSFPTSLDGQIVKV